MRQIREEGHLPALRLRAAAPLHLGDPGQPLPASQRRVLAAANVPGLAHEPVHIMAAAIPPRIPRQISFFRRGHRVVGDIRVQALPAGSSSRGVRTAGHVQGCHQRYDLCIHRRSRGRALLRSFRHEAHGEDERGAGRDRVSHLQLGARGAVTVILFRQAGKNIKPLCASHIHQGHRGRVTPHRGAFAAQVHGVLAANRH
mmetsp:Transcript_97595/g.260468  ORF Transcript_97595/g.260468 Transcript_97595/m.260468 type:complete len:200 (-) Transcript_97595:225-824(-)